MSCTTTNKLVNLPCASILCVNVHNTSLAHKYFGKDFILTVTELTAKYTDENQVSAALALLNTLIHSLSMILRLLQHLSVLKAISSHFPMH